MIKQHELHKLEDISQMNDAKMKEIKGLRDNVRPSLNHYTILASNEGVS